MIAPIWCDVVLDLLIETLLHRVDVIQVVCLSTGHLLYRFPLASLF